MPIAIFAAFVPTVPPPMITTLPGATPGTPESRMPLPPFAICSAQAPTWVREPSRDFRHRHQQRQAAVGRGHRLVGNTAHVALEHRCQQRRGGREMLVAEQDLVGVGERKFLRLQLFDLDDEIARVGFRRGGDDLCAGGAVSGIVEAHGGPGPRLNPHFVAGGGEHMRARRGEADPVLVVLDFLRHADSHGIILLRAGADVPVVRGT